MRQDGALAPGCAFLDQRLAVFKKAAWRTTQPVTAGIAVGTTSGGANVIAPQACGANCLVFVADSALLKRGFSTTVQQARFITPVRSVGSRQQRA